MTAHCPVCRRAVAPSDRYCAFDGTPLAISSAENLVGKLLAGRYQVESLIGRGGMATVYQARHRVLKRDVAIKVLHPPFGEHPEALKRFAREAKASARLRHKNVVEVYDFDQDRGRGFYFLALELVRGHQLNQLLAKGQMPIANAIHILTQFAEAVFAAHSVSIIHRDLKPENILIATRGDDPYFVKVLDFGLAKSSALPNLTMHGQKMGTPRYMAPEQWNCEPMDARTDIFAFGVVAFNVLTSHRPIHGESPAEIMHACLNGARPLASQFRPDVPPPLDALVARCLAVDKNDRPASMEEIITLVRSNLAAPAPTVELTAVTEAPTSFRAPELIWEGSALVEQISRLHVLRARRLRELLEVAFPDSSGEIRSLFQQVEAPEARVKELVAIIIAKQEEHEANERALDGEEISVQRELVDVMFDGAAPRRTELERQLASVLYERHSARLVFDIEIERAFRALRQAESTLTPLYDKLARFAQKSAREHVRAHLVEFSKIDGAIASHHGMLEALFK